MATLPAITSNLSSTPPLQPYAGPGMVYRNVVFSMTNGTATLTATNISASGMSGVVGVSGVVIGAAAATASGFLSVNATANTDGTLSSGGTLSLVSSQSNPHDWLLTLVSRT